jgi:Ser/Thr protein kinase RdoA (MazF antagonist)
MEEERLATDLVREWLGERASLTPLVAMNSSAWMVSSGGDRYVLKISPAVEEAGLLVAAWLEDHALPTGAPVRKVVRDDRVSALLRFVDGRGLGTSGADIALLGETLGRVHSLLLEAPVPEKLERWPWAWLDPNVIEEPDLRRAARQAIDAAETLAPTLTHGILHGDPAPDAFVASAEGVALIDWGSACHGPLLYDLASAWLYTDQRIIAAYARAGPLAGAELDQAADFLVFRWAVQACYFSARISRGDVRGLASPAENDKGLADARRGLLGAS